MTDLDSDIFIPNMSFAVVKSCLANLNINSKVNRVTILCSKSDEYGSSEYLIGELKDRYIAIKHWSGYISDDKNNTYDTFDDFSSAERYLRDLGGRLR